MKISIQISVILAAIFATICFGAAIGGFTALPGITDPVQHADASGFAWFWAFLGAVSVGIGGLGLWLMRTDPDREGA
jgi:hypothetical protein